MALETSTTWPTAADGPLEVRQPPSLSLARPLSPGRRTHSYLTMPLSLSHAVAAALASCFWLPLTARLRLIRSSVVRVLETEFSACLALSVIFALLYSGRTCWAMKLFLGSSSTTRSLSAMDGVVV